jgi:hypothetical protein
MQNGCSKVIIKRKSTAPSISNPFLVTSPIPEPILKSRMFPPLQDGSPFYSKKLLTNLDFLAAKKSERPPNFLKNHANEGAKKS